MYFEAGKTTKRRPNRFHVFDVEKSVLAHFGLRSSGSVCGREETHSCKLVPRHLTEVHSRRTFYNPLFNMFIFPFTLEDFNIMRRSQNSNKNIQHCPRGMRSREVNCKFLVTYKSQRAFRFLN